MSKHTVKDPVCGMDVDPHTTEHRSQHAGKPWYFCSSHCKTKFDANPEGILRGEKEATIPAPCTQKFAKKAQGIALFAVWV